MQAQRASGTPPTPGKPHRRGSRASPDRNLRVQALRAAGTPPTPGVPYRWGKPTKLTDVENNGYTFTPPEPPAPVEGARPQNYSPQT